MNSSLASPIYSPSICACGLGNLLGTRASLGLRPVVRRSLGGSERLRVLVARRHRGRRACHDLMVLDIEKPQPALLSEGETDHAAELDQLRLAELLVHAI